MWDEILHGGLIARRGRAGRLPTLLGGPNIVGMPPGAAPEPPSPPPPFPLDGRYVLAAADGSMAVVGKEGPPPRIAGLTFGFHHVTGDSGHAGERHADGDELIVVLTGAVTVEVTDDAGGTTRTHVPAGHGCVVPRGAWHRLLVSTPTTIAHATPGPGFEVRW